MLLEKRSKICSNEGTILKGSIFQSARLNMEHLLILLCEWVKNCSNFSASAGLDILYSTVNRWFTRFNNCVYNYVYRYLRYQTIGGPGCIVEIDEPILVRNKYHNCRLLQYQVLDLGRCLRRLSYVFLRSRRR
jgi:hypothetical protein